MEPMAIPHKHQNQKRQLASLSRRKMRIRSHHSESWMGSTIYITKCKQARPPPHKTPLGASEKLSSTAYKT